MKLDGTDTALAVLMAIMITCGLGIIVAAAFAITGVPSPGWALGLFAGVLVMVVLPLAYLFTKKIFAEKVPR